jgi:hypothetical protein
MEDIFNAGLNKLTVNEGVLWDKGDKCNETSAFIEKCNFRIDLHGKQGKVQQFYVLQVRAPSFTFF